MNKKDKKSIIYLTFIITINILAVTHLNATKRAKRCVKRCIRRPIRKSTCNGCFGGPCFNRVYSNCFRPKCASYAYYPYAGYTWWY